MTLRILAHRAFYKTLNELPLLKINNYKISRKLLENQATLDPCLCIQSAVVEKVAILGRVGGPLVLLNLALMPAIRMEKQDKTEK